MANIDDELLKVFFANQRYGTSAPAGACQTRAQRTRLTRTRPTRNASDWLVDLTLPADVGQFVESVATAFVEVRATRMTFVHQLSESIELIVGRRLTHVPKLIDSIGFGENMTHPFVQFQRLFYTSCASCRWEVDRWRVLTSVHRRFQTETNQFVECHMQLFGHFVQRVRRFMKSVERERLEIGD
jgi:hypothetical protein